MEHPDSVPGERRERVEERERLIALLDEVAAESIVRHYYGTTEETMLQCLLCGDWEGHKATCPVPVIERWLGNEQDPQTDDKESSPHRESDQA